MMIPSRRNRLHAAAVPLMASALSTLSNLSDLSYLSNLIYRLFASILILPMPKPLSHRYYYTYYPSFPCFIILMLVLSFGHIFQSHFLSYSLFPFFNSRVSGVGIPGVPVNGAVPGSGVRRGGGGRPKMPYYIK